MAIKAYPLNDIDYNAQDAQVYNATRTNGVYSPDKDFLLSMTGTDLNATVSEGQAWMKSGRFSGITVWIDSPETIKFSIADNNFDRIDAVVLKFDTLTNKPVLLVKQGTPTSSPQLPDRVQNLNTIELHLYHVLRKAGSVTVQISDVTDVRRDPKWCGIMKDAITGVDVVNDETIRIYERLGMKHAK